MAFTVKSGVSCLSALSTVPKQIAEKDYYFKSLLFTVSQQLTGRDASLFYVPLYFIIYTLHRPVCDQTK